MLANEPASHPHLFFHFVDRNPAQLQMVGKLSVAAQYETALVANQSACYIHRASGFNH